VKEGRAPAAPSVLLPGAFLLLWASGYAACKAAVLHASAFEVLFVRCGGAVLILAVLALAARAPWPTRRGQWMHLAVCGVLIHAIYLGINFWAAAHGFPVGITALIGALQPLLTAVIAALFLGERIQSRQWLGLVLGLGGVVLVLSDKVAFGWSDPAQPLLVGFALLCLTVGTLYQKKFCGFMDWRTGMVGQLWLPCLLMGMASWLAPAPVDMQPVFIGAMAWLVLVSTAVYGMLHLLFLRGEAARTASLFYLVPVMTSSFMYLLFGERLGALALLGMLLAVSGVALASLRTERRAVAA
jgi:drug/metabolite transporter (DMT)-like permease